MGTPEYVGESVLNLTSTNTVICTDSVLSDNWCVCVLLSLAPEILNYEPISTATDMW